MRPFVLVTLLTIASLWAQDPIDARGWLNRGVSDFKAANYAAATAAFEQAVASDPSFVTGRLYLGTALMQQWIPGAQTPENDHFAEAANQQFLKVLELDPANQTAMHYIASLKLNQKKWDEAQAAYERITAADPNDATAWYSLGFIAWSRWYPAYMEARKSVGMKPQDPGPLPGGGVKSQLKTTFAPILDSGIRALQQGLLINPKYDDAMAYMNLLIRERADLFDTSAEYRQEVAIADEWVQKALQTKQEKAGARAGALPSSTAPESMPGRINVGRNVVTANLLTSVPAVYPVQAAGKQGNVLLSIVVGRDGKVTDATYLSGEAAFAESAIKAVRQWVYRPTLLNGEPVEVATQVEMNFRPN